MYASVFFVRMYVCMYVFVIGASVLSMCFSGYGAGAAAQNGYGAKGELAILFMKLICT